MTRTVELAEEDRVVSWLLKQDNPGVRFWTLRDLLGRSETNPEVVAARNSIGSWGPVAELFREQRPEGFWGEPEDVYWPKWRATVWQLILLAELGVPGDDPRVRRGCEYFLRMMDLQDRAWPPANYPDGDLRGWRLVWEPCVTGNMARTLVVFGLGEDPRVREMFEWLVRYQLPDGGWNCETGEWGKDVCHSSFMSTVEPLWAFSELPRQGWPKGGREAVERACKFMLMHRLYKSDKTGRVINEEWIRLHFPLFYFYDILHGLRVLTGLGYADDERMNDAIKLLLSKRSPDSWPMEASFLRALRRNLVKDPGTGEWHVDKKENVDLSKIYRSGGNVADIPNIYGSVGTVGSANPWISLNALRVLKGRQ